MKIVNQSAVLLEQGNDPYKLIESAGRTCYKSESRGNPVAFVKGLAKSKHLAMLEFAYVYFKLEDVSMQWFLEQLAPSDTKFLNIANDYISGSFRAFIELADRYIDVAEDYDGMILIEMIRQLSDAYPDVFEYNLEWYTLAPSYGNVEMLTRQEFINDVKSMDSPFDDCIISALLPHVFRFVTNRGISHELVRHRLCSFAQESQRYVGYDKDKFGSEITVIKPLIEEGSKDWEEWKYAVEWCETVYKNLRGRGVAPQIARGILPNDCKTEIVVGATEDEWQHILDLRYHGKTGAPHPQIKELMGLAYPILTEQSEGRVR